MGYYGGWNKWTFNFLVFPNTTRRSYNSIDSITIDNSQIIQNKEMIGNIKIDDDLGRSCSNYMNFTLLKNLLDKPNYLNHLEIDYDYFKVLK